MFFFLLPLLQVQGEMNTEHFEKATLECVLCVYVYECLCHNWSKYSVIPSLEPGIRCLDLLERGGWFPAQHEAHHGGKCVDGVQAQSLLKQDLTVIHCNVTTH